MNWKLLHPKASLEMLGFIPHFLSEANPQRAREQLHNAYAHGGGWLPLSGWSLLPDGRIQYPGDEPVLALAETKLRDETIRVYLHAWVAIIQPDGTFEVSRMD